MNIKRWGKKIFNKGNLIAPIVVAIFLVLTLGSINSNFIGMINDTFFTPFNMRSQQATVIIVMKWFVHKGVLIYILANIFSYEKDIYLKYELIRYRSKCKLISKKCKNIAIYVTYYYSVIFLVMYISTITLGSKKEFSLVEITGTIYVMISLILINIFYGLIMLFLVWVFEVKMGIVGILLIDILYIVSGENYLYNKLYTANHLIEISEMMIIDLWSMVVILILGIIYFLNLYSNKYSLID